MSNFNVPFFWLWLVGFLISWPIAAVLVIVVGVDNGYFGRVGAVRVSVGDVAIPCAWCGLLAIFWPVLVVPGLVVFSVAYGATGLANLVLARRRAEAAPDDRPEDPHADLPTTTER